MTGVSEGRVLLCLAAPHYVRPGIISNVLNNFKSTLSINVVTVPAIGVFAETIREVAKPLGMTVIGQRLEYPWDKTSKGFTALCESLLSTQPIATVLFSADAEATAVATMAAMRGIPGYRVKGCGTLLAPR